MRVKRFPQKPKKSIPIWPFGDEKLNGYFRIGCGISKSGKVLLAGIKQRISGKGTDHGSQ
jgi:hypothetical protein